MKKNIFAVCDLEVDYALNFMDYLNRKKNIPFEITGIYQRRESDRLWENESHRVAADFPEGYVPSGTGIGNW